jgi:hypothetical protein
LCVWLLNSIHRCPKWIAPKYIGIKTSPRFFQWNQRSKFRKEYHRNTPRIPAFTFGTLQCKISTFHLLLRWYPLVNCPITMENHHLLMGNNQL